MPIILVIVFFQVLVLRQPIPHFKQLIGGLVLIVVGLAFFLIGLELVDPVVAAIETAGRLDEHGTGVVFVPAVERGAGIRGRALRAGIR